MNSVINSVQRFGTTVMQEVGKFDPIAWGVLAVCSVVFGFMLLRGNVFK